MGFRTAPIIIVAFNLLDSVRLYKNYFGFVHSSVWFGITYSYLQYYVPNFLLLFRRSYSLTDGLKINVYDRPNIYIVFKSDSDG